MKIIFTCLIGFFALAATAQILPVDTVSRLKEVTVKGYYNVQPLLRSVSAVSMIDSNQLRNQQNSSLVSILNTIPGVRMEERSPGSYRLSLRGSLLRSPFGIRNIKIYIDDFPLTDAGGNTYLNSLDFSAISSLEIYKGPDASVYGANTGGALLINSTSEQNKIEATVTSGSYGLFHQSVSIQQHFKHYTFSLTGAYQKSNGYRQNSALSRKFIQTAQQWNYSASGTLKFFAFYSDLDYQTPGGLTAFQYEQDSRLARPSTSTVPGALAQQAAIYNKTTFGGFSNTYRFSDHFNHVIALFGSYTDFKNPFITNYEQRYESTLGLRTFLEYHSKIKQIRLNAQAGLESSETKSRIKNFVNNLGTAGNLQAYDALKAHQNFGFIRLNVDLDSAVLIEAATSLNFFNYDYTSLYPIRLSEQKKTFNTAFMPKLAVSYLLSSDFSARASVSKGYSAPTLAEIRSSNNVINTNLDAENGWNYEIGLRYKGKNDRFYVNGNLFLYKLKDAIVRRLNQNDSEYFINAGGTKQTGLELESAIWIIRNQVAGLSGLQLRGNYTYSHFRFSDFLNASMNYSGNLLTGVPNHVLLASLEADFKPGFYVFVQHNFTSAIPLNDANTVFANRYNLSEAKAGFRNIKIYRLRLELFAGVNNIFNERYSLGNDLNAANNRYFNPAALINFYAGVSIKL